MITEARPMKFLTHDREWAWDVQLETPLTWRKPQVVRLQFDLFDNAGFETIDRVFAVMALTPHITYQILTKRPEWMAEYFCERWQGRTDTAALGLPPDPDPGHGREFVVEQAMFELAEKQGMLDPENEKLWTTTGMSLVSARWSWPLPNVWLGTSVEDQATADARIPHLLKCPAAVRFLSCEPLLGAIDLTHTTTGPETDGIGLTYRHWNALTGDNWCDFNDWIRPIGTGPIGWVIAGGESGKNARPAHPDWFRSLRDQCQAAGVPFFFKQWGEWAPGENANKPATRTERIATLWDNKWIYGTLTPRQSEELHVDDQPDVFHFGKKAAGRLLDGKEHNGFPE